MKYTIRIDREDDGRWIGEVPEIPGVLVYGATATEAERLVKALALRSIADLASSQGEAVPGVVEFRSETPELLAALRAVCVPGSAAITVWNDGSLHECVPQSDMRTLRIAAQRHFGEEFGAPTPLPEGNEVEPSEPPPDAPTAAPQARRTLRACLKRFNTEPVGIGRIAAILAMSAVVCGSSWHLFGMPVAVVAMLAIMVAVYHLERWAEGAPE